MNHSSTGKGAARRRRWAVGWRYERSQRGVAARRALRTRERRFFTPPAVRGQAAPLGVLYDHEAIDIDERGHIQLLLFCSLVSEGRGRVGRGGC